MTKTYTDAPCPILNQKGRNIGHIWSFYGRLECPTIVNFGSDTDELAYFRVISAATSGDLEGVRGRVESEAETGTTMNINAFHGDAVVNADGYAATARGIYTDAMIKDDATVTSVRGGDFNVSIYDGASITNSEGLRVRVGHPTAAVSISGVDTLLHLILDGSNLHTAKSAIDIDCQTGTTLTTGIDMGDSCVTAIDIGACTTGIKLDSAMTDGILISGACGDNAIEITGACTDSAIKISGTAIIASGEQAIYVNCTAETAAVNGVWVTIDSTVITGDMSGGRFNVGANAASAGPNIRACRARADMSAASKFAAYMCGGMFEVSMAAGTATISGNIEVLVAHYSQGASVSCANFAAIKAVIQTRGDETVTTVDTGLWILNEAVGGTGRCMDSAIKIQESTMGGGIKAFGTLIDASGVGLTLSDSDTKVALMKFKDAGGTERIIYHDTDDATALVVA